MPTADQQVHLVTAAVGFTSYGLLWLTAVWGIVLRGGRPRRPAVYGVHMTAGLTALTLGAVHGAAQLAAPSGPVRAVDLFVPFVNPADRLGIGAGVLGLELTVAATLAVLAQRRLGAGRWQALHSLTYLAFTLVVAHILISGPDTAAPAVWGAVVASWLFTMLLWFTTTPLAARLRPLLRLGRGARADRSDAYYRRPVSPAARAQPDLGDVAVAVDAGRCVRFGFCEREAPDLFRLRDDGRLAFRAAVPPGLVDAAVRAAESCPARAIALTRAAAGAFDRWGSDTPAREPRTRPVDVQVSYEPEPEPYEDGYDYDRRYYDDRRR